MTSSTLPARPAPTTFGNGLRRLVLAAGVLGAAWNLFGIVRWFASLGATAESLVAGGLDPAQAALVAALPRWMDVAFGLGVWGGLLGSLALLWRRRAAKPLLGVSLAAYAVLFAGDAGFGIFAAMPRQLPILVAVVLIAVGLLIVARRAGSRGALR